MNFSYYVLYGSRYCLLSSYCIYLPLIFVNFITRMIVLWNIPE